MEGDFDNHSHLEIKEELLHSEFYSVPVQEILGFVPSWTIRWGIAVIFILLIILLSISWIIKYPDLIEGQITIITESPIIKIKSKTSGVLLKIFKEEGSNIKANESIAEIHSTLSKDGYLFLNHLLSLEIEQITPETLQTDLTFGNIQEEYNKFKKFIYDLNSQFEENKFIASKNNLVKRIKNFEDIIAITKDQIFLLEEELIDAQTRLSMQEKLYNNKVISKLDYLDAKATFNTKKKELQNHRKSLVQNRMTLTTSNASLLEIQFDYEEKIRKIKNQINISLQNIHKFLKDWKEQYVIEAPIGGTLTFLTNIHENEFINASEFPFAIVPKDQNFIGEVHISIRNSGKVKVGQNVIISLFDYPSEEFGKLRGIVTKISNIANENLYRLEVSLPHKLTTSYEKSVKYKPKMEGIAEIITEDLRLVERIFYNFRELVGDSI